MKQRSFSTAMPYLDRIGVFLSATCLLHCLALPVLLTIAPITQTGLMDEQTFHLVLLWFILPVSLIALGIGCRQHKDLIIVLLGGTGLSLLLFAGLLGHTYLSPPTERVLTVVAGLILAAAHLRNFKICRATNCDHEDSTHR
ncbi:MAG: MerC domain-containing protein [Pseudomonadales bacterium]|jgi:hypothetical protein|tara:strand:- start:43 stop:468 length:426 start_codon:yes stop_codon:yes gene_type:complete